MERASKNEKANYDVKYISKPTIHSDHETLPRQIQKAPANACTDPSADQKNTEDSYISVSNFFTLFMLHL